jgi:hypothetical protein
MNPGRARQRHSARAGLRGAVQEEVMRIPSLLAAALMLAGVAGTSPAAAGGRHTDAIIAGAAGFAVGTIFGNATARPRYYAPAPVYVAPAPPPFVYQPAPVYYVSPPAWTPEWYAYCSRRYGSFDLRSGTYLGYDGYRHMCD